MLVPCYAPEKKKCYIDECGRDITLSLLFALFRRDLVDLLILTSLVFKPVMFDLLSDERLKPITLASLVGVTGAVESAVVEALLLSAVIV